MAYVDLKKKTSSGVKNLKMFTCPPDKYNRITKSDI